MTDPSAPKRIFINGRFLRGPITGTSRVAEEVLAVWDRAIAAGQPEFHGFRIELLMPKDVRRELTLQAIPATRKQVLGGKFWELVDLALMAWSGTLVNFANIAPLYHPRGVTYLHDAQVFLHPESYTPMHRRTHRPLAKLAGHTAKRVITVSQFSSEALQRFGVAKAARITPIHNGADHITRNPARQEVLAAKGLTPQGYALMYDSNFTYKNVEVVLEAFRRMGPDAPKLGLIARKDQRRTSEAPPELRERMVVLSGIDDGELRALYENALVFLQPATTEGFAMTQLEALLCGAPVITTRGGSMPEVLGEDVLYAPADSPDAWGAAILRFRQEPGFRDAMLQRGQPMAQRYTWQKTADALWREVRKVATGQDSLS